LIKQDFKILYHKYVAQIRNYIYYRSGDVDLADDITQEVFIKIYQNNKWRNDDVKSLLYKMAGDLFIDYVRKKNLEREYQKNIKFEFTEQNNDEYKNEILQKCEKALSVLSDNERLVFLMNKKDGITYKDIAESLDISVKAVEKRMSSALNKLNQS